jgi:nucleoid DNA-binding protein
MRAIPNRSWLEVYLDLIALMIDAQQLHDEKLEDAVTDVLDVVWFQLSAAEKIELNKELKEYF